MSAFSVEFAAEIVLQESIFLNQDNCLLSSRGSPGFHWCELSIAKIGLNFDNEVSKSLNEIEHMVSLTCQRMNSTTSSKLRTKHSRACSSPCHNMVDFGITFVTQKLLLCNLQLTRNFASMFAWCRFKLASHVLCDAGLLISNKSLLLLSPFTQYSYNYGALPHGSR